VASSKQSFSNADRIETRWEGDHGLSSTRMLQNGGKKAIVIPPPFNPMLGVRSLPKFFGAKRQGRSTLDAISTEGEKRGGGGKRTACCVFARRGRGRKKEWLVFLHWCCCSRKNIGSASPFLTSPCPEEVERKNTQIRTILQGSTLPLYVSPWKSSRKTTTPRCANG